MDELENPFRVRLRLHVTAPGGRQSMVVNVDVPVAFAGIPVGGIVAWAKSLAGCPDLPVNWELCDGHTCVNATSPFYGVVIPNLNGASAQPQRFLRGAAASGATGGEDSHSLSIAELAAHTHGLVYKACNPGTGSTNVVETPSGSAAATGSAGSGTAHENRPCFYEVVFVMRVY